MIKHKWIGVIAALLMAVAVLAIGFAYMNPSAFVGVGGTKEPDYVAAMDKNRILDIEILADEKEWANMLENATAEEYILATVVINGTKIENVGIRPKGNSSLSMVAMDDTTDRFSFKIEFDHYIDGQTWLGLDKIALNNIQGDATYMKEYLSYDIMDYIGVESPLYAFTNVSVNGETWGFYLAVECLEDSFIQRAYGKNHGELYKPEGMGMLGQGRMGEFKKADERDKNAEQARMQPQNRPQGLAPNNNDVPNPQNPQNPLIPPDNLEGNLPGNPPDNPGGRFGGKGMGGMSSNGVSLQYIDDNTSSYSAIFDNSVFDTNESDQKRVVNALKKLSKGEDLENTVDVEAVLKYFAAHTVVVNLDSYVANMGHNYYLYEKDGQLTILPWDYNLAFGGFQSGSASDVVNFPIDTPVSGVSLEDRPLLGKLLEVPEYMEMYHDYLRQIVDGYFNSGLFEQTVDSMNSLISPYVEADPTAFYDYDAYKTGVVELKKLGLLRALSIEGQLNGTIPSTSEGQKADSSKLIDASSINLSALGSQGGGGPNRGPGDMGRMQWIDMEKMQKAMAILQEAGDNELTEEQLSQLKELGLTDELIEQFKNMLRNGFGGLSGGMGGRREQGPGGMGGRPDQGPGNLAGGPPGNDLGGGNPVPPGQNPGFGMQSSGITSGFDAKTWLYLGSCTILLLAGLLFVVVFKRRRGA